MTPPADLAALRALVERVGVVSVYCSCYGCKAIKPLAPAAREALERVGKTEWAIYKEDIAKIKAAHWLQVQALQARLARLEGALAKIMPSIMLLRPVIGGPWLDTWEREARATLEGHPTDAATAEWQRVHGPVIQGDAAVTSEASAQAARDVAHWRTRAEHAEARLAKLEDHNG